MRTLQTIHGARWRCARSGGARSALLPLLFVASLAACGSSDDDDAPAPTDFDAFVTDLVENGTTETGEPVPINGRAFAFDEDPTAFDDLFGPPPP